MYENLSSDAELIYDMGGKFFQPGFFKNNQPGFWNNLNHVSTTKTNLGGPDVALSSTVYCNFCDKQVNMMLK